MQRLAVIGLKMWKLDSFCVSVSHEFAATCVPIFSFPVSQLESA